MCCFAILLCCCCWLAFLSISWSDCSCPGPIIKVDEDESVQDGEDNLEKESNKEGHSDEQSSTETESDSVLCTLSTRYGILYLMYSLVYVHIYVRICCTDISYTLLWNNSYFHIHQ